MDREIDPSLIRRRKVRRAAVTVTALVLCWFAVATLFGLLRPAVRASEIRTARVTRGQVAEVIDATGIVVPAAETVLSSPIETRVVEVLAKPGAVLEPGDPILRLDTSSSRLEVERLSDRLGQKESERTQLQLSLEKELFELETRAEQQQLDAEVLHQDSGPGLAPGTREQLFTPFFTTKREGRGIGLTLVREIAMQHGADLSFRNVLEGGAEFAVTLRR